MNSIEPEQPLTEREPLFSDLFGLSADTFPKDIDPIDYVRALRDGADD